MQVPLRALGAGTEGPSRVRVCDGLHQGPGVAHCLPGTPASPGLPGASSSAGLPELYQGAGGDKGPSSTREPICPFGVGAR